MAKGSKKPATNAPPTDEEQDKALADREKKMSWVEIAERNQGIVEAKARGLSWTQVAETYGLSDRQCRNIHREWRESNPTLRHRDPLDIVDELLEGYAADLSELVIIGASADNDNARIGAVNSRANIRGRITELLQALGVLPHDLGQLHVEIDARFVAQQVVRVLNDHGASPELKADLTRALRAGEQEVIEADGTPVAA